MPLKITRPGPAIACVTLSNPNRRNALDGEMFDALATLWPELADDDTIRAVILQGEGAHFCAGADLSAHLDRRSDVDDMIEAALLKTAFFPKPLVVAIEGACVAGGLELALAADLRIVSSDARMGFPEVRWGIMPSGGATMKLERDIGHCAARSLLLTGRIIDGAEAMRLGLVSELVSPGSASTRALELAEILCTNSPVAMLAVKAATEGGHALPYRVREALERQIVREVRASGHPETGKAAFLDGTPPDYDWPPHTARSIRTLVDR